MPTLGERLAQSLSGRYSIEREGGEGGMATVFLARDLRHDRQVAIKVLREDVTQTRLDREGQIPVGPWWSR
jgi:serine/threonine protein kinase